MVVAFHVCALFCVYFEPEFPFVVLLVIGPLEDLFVYVGKMDDHN